jgi:4-amino-4-deoxy-L-arabinose transferase-like glycosyltransferase
MGKRKILFIILFLSAAGLRFADTFRPINQASWRECDLGAISRNFVQEGMNPLYPRIDWRGDGPGYAEMEFPLFPFLTAVTYKIFGIHDFVGRVWAFLFSLGALFFFFRLAREYLDEFSSIIAFAFFALNPLVVDESTALQPEGLMLFSYIGAVYFFIRWIKTNANTHLIGAGVMTALALLAKAPAAHIGLFFVILLLRKYGVGAIKQSKVWLFGLMSISPAASWYFHAKNLWLTYGNSLGVSNEYHWIGLDFFTSGYFIEGILISEFHYVWISFGLIAGIFAVWKGHREKVARHSLLWLASIFALYILAARTTSEDWANYYHIFSIPPAALIFGLSISKLWEYGREFTDGFGRRRMDANFGRALLIFAVTVAVLGTLLSEAKQVRASFLGKRVNDAAHVCAEKIKPAMQTGGLIVVSGGHCVDKNGYALAYNASFMFYWLDRKGWNICVEEQSIDKIKTFAASGAKYFVAQKSMLEHKTEFENDLRNSYRIVDECDEFLVFELDAAT